jgi:putative ABC transport system substrate-binding protein
VTGEEIAMFRIKRRKFLALIASAAAAWPVAAQAQRGKVPIIGLLSPSTASTDRERIAVFKHRLAELGWIEGAGVEFDLQRADGKSERFSEIAADLVRRKVDVIVTWGTTTALAAKQATSTIPIVFTIVGDPVGSDLVASLARPSGNVTGLSTQHADSAGKRLELLREIVPDLHRMAIMVNVTNPGPMQEMRDVEAMSHKLGIEIAEMDVRRSEDIAPAFEAVKGKTQALYVTADALFNVHRTRIGALALDARLPTVHGFSEIVAAGGLMSYAANYLDLFQRAADYVDKILRGAKPADIPVEQPTKFDLVINLTTAKALGLTVPDKLLALADDVIE